jgi:hypothetical protein
MGNNDIPVTKESPHQWGRAFRVPNGSLTPKYWLLTHSARAWVVALVLRSVWITDAAVLSDRAGAVHSSPGWLRVGFSTDN